MYTRTVERRLWEYFSQLLLSTSNRGGEKSANYVQVQASVSNVFLIREEQNASEKGPMFAMNSTSGVLNSAQDKSAILRIRLGVWDKVLLDTGSCT